MAVSIEHQRHQYRQKKINSWRLNIEYIIIRALVGIFCYLWLKEIVTIQQIELRGYVVLVELLSILCCGVILIRTIRNEITLFICNKYRCS